MKLRKAGPNHYNFYCPGCECYHGFNNTWDFNGDMEKPTVSPSLLSSPVRCHLFIREGNIEYLTDCEHKLAGQIVPLRDEND